MLIRWSKAELVNELESLKSRLEAVGASGESDDTVRRKQNDSELIARIRQQEIVVYLGHKALHDGDMIPLMNEAVKAIADILDNEYCKILELMPDGKTFLLRAGVGWKKGLVGHATVSAGPDSQAGYTLQSGKPVIVDDIKKDKRFSGPLLLHEHNVVSGMSVVIQGQKGPWGVLGTHTTRHTSYSKDDINLLKAVANILADIIARKEAEDTLRESEEKYHKLVESANDAIFVADTETGIIIDVNKRAEQMIGLPAEKIIGMHQMLLHPPEKAERYKRIFEDHINSGKAISKDAFVCNKDGEKIPVEISASITELKGRKIIQGIFRDITERRRAEEKLQEQKKALEQKNIALSEILGQIEIEKKQIKDNVISNAENLLLPVIQKLKITGESRKYVQLLQKNLKELTSSFGTRMAEKGAKLTSREIEICDMIKNGLTNKEIASLSNISIATIERHRANIRKKLGIIKKDINLSSFLKTL